jgi:sugar phosphate permease
MHRTENHSSLVRRKYLHVLLPLFITSFISTIDRINVAFAALTMNKDLGFSAQVYGMGAGIFFLAYFVFEVPGAYIAARWSATRWLARIMISWGVVCLLMGFMHTAAEFYVYRFLLGAAEASLYPVCYAVVLPRWFTAAETPKATSVLLTSLLAAIIVNAPVAGWLLGVTALGFKGWQSLFILEGIPAIVFGVVLLYWLVDWPEQAKWLTPEEARLLRENYERETARKTAVKKVTFWQALGDKEVLKLCFTYFLWMTGYQAFNYWLPTVLKAVSGWSNRTTGFVIVIPMTLALIGFVVNGSHSSRTGEKRWHVAIPLLIAAFGMSVGTAIKDPFLGLILVCITAVGAYVGMGVWWTYPTAFLSGPAAAGAVGLINSCGSMGGWLGPYITGYLKDLTGSFRVPYLAFSVALVCSALLILTLRRKLPAQEAAETPAKDQVLV